MSTPITPSSVDLRQAVRRLWKRPGFSLLVVAVLGIGLYPSPLLEAMDASVTYVVERVVAVSIAP